MSVETDLYGHLSTYAGLTPLTGTRIYPMKAPPGTASPYCTYQVVSDLRQYSHAGYSGLSRYRVQVSCFANDTKAGAPGYPSVKAVAAQVLAAMEAWHSSNPKVQSCLLDGDHDEFEESVSACHIPLDFIVWYG